MESLQSKLSTIEEAMADGGLYDANRKDELNELIRKQGELKSALEDAEVEWMELTEQLEGEE
jgi:ATP-binding cassette subfamily F protein 3